MDKTKPSVVEALNIAAAAKDVITAGQWEVDSKTVSISLPKENDNGLAKAVIKELQHRVRGYTPNLATSEDTLTITTKKNFWEEAKRAISAEQGRQAR